MLSDRFRTAVEAGEIAGSSELFRGIDKLTFDEDGRITELKVMLRPASALQVVGVRMAEEFARLGLGSPPERGFLLPLRLSGAQPRFRMSIRRRS